MRLYFQYRKYNNYIIVKRYKSEIKFHNIRRDFIDSSRPFFLVKRYIDFASNIPTLQIDLKLFIDSATNLLFTTIFSSTSLNISKHQESKIAYSVSFWEHNCVRFFVPCNYLLFLHFFVNIFYVNTLKTYLLCNNTY